MAQGYYIPNESGRWVILVLFVHVTTDVSVCVFTRAAAYFEQGEYDKSIEACQKAVEEGREVILLFFAI